MRLILAWLVVAISPSAQAGVVTAATGERVGYPTGTGDGVAFSVEVGRTAERSVGNANGWFCDDPSLIKAAIVTRGDVNYWVVTGLEVGATQCRVGTDPSRSTVVFDVTVKRPSSKRRL